jgi:2-keto-4-pentenoate hydratase/2-oxohepta-3-ene-1,7-dioic acid hydratase in catechol pathway
MIYLRFQTQGKTRYGVLDGKTVHEIRPDFFSSFRKTGKKYPLSTVTLLAPCQPGKVIAMGLNYVDHAKELRMPLPLQPLFFLKAPSATIGPKEKIVYPPSSKRVDYEAELAVVIGKKAKDITPQQASEYILGYTCFNDVTARDLQDKDGQWSRSKSFDTFAPLGPWIVSDIDPNNLAIETVLNGKTVQRSSTRELIFKIDEIVSFVSQVMTLEPGDVIATGTPPGVGPVKRGDRIKIKIQDIGVLENRIA